MNLARHFYWTRISLSLLLASYPYNLFEKYVFTFMWVMNAIIIQVFQAILRHLMYFPLLLSFLYLFEKNACYVEFCKRITKNVVIITFIKFLTVHYPVHQWILHRVKKCYTYKKEIDEALIIFLEAKSSVVKWYFVIALYMKGFFFV